MKKIINTVVAFAVLISLYLCFRKEPVVSIGKKAEVAPAAITFTPNVSNKKLNIKERLEAFGLGGGISSVEVHK